MADCSKNFAQRQHLDRHLEIKHQDTTPQTTYYHCTVDGCKYASTGRPRKRFARADQVKEHIKDYGHYGPHSANDRMRRPGKELWDEHQIVVWFEKWTLEEGTNQNLTPQRILQSCQYNSYKTKLWHKDDIGGQFLRGGTSFSGHACLVPDCYYQSKPIEGLGVIPFKTSKELEEHLRDAHESPKRIASISSQLQLHSSEEQRRKVSLECFEYAEDTEAVLPGPLAVPTINLDLAFLNKDQWWLDGWPDYSVPLTLDSSSLSWAPNPHSAMDYSFQSRPGTVSTQESWPATLSSLEAPSMLHDGCTNSDKNRLTYPSIV